MLFLPTCCLFTVYLLTIRWFYNSCCLFCAVHFVLLLLTLFLPTSCLSTVFVGDKMVLQLHLSVLCSLHSASDRQDSDPTCHLECQVGQTGLRQTGPQMPGHWGLSGHSSQHSSESTRFSFCFISFILKLFGFYEKCESAPCKDHCRLRRQKRWPSCRLTATSFRELC